ncbi:hypothetical protein [Vibrio tubiashii]|uniref:hypothetical protein n=1 Tax=Vibrio tubiashii TaxID=29498 RepID=UPI00148DFF5D|nr:hypothetical protein [Vibrio tubiashii]
MAQNIPQTTYQYIIELEDQELAKANTIEEELQIRTHFCAVRDAIYQRDWASFNTVA